jgi:hypothetical protein
VVWVDRETKLLQESLVDGRKAVFTYGGAGFASIYDAGAAREGRTIDCRPEARTKAVYERLLARFQKPLPEGVLVRSSVMSYLAGLARSQANLPVSEASMEVHWMAGVRRGYWEYREAGLPGAERGKMAVPEVWDQAGEEEFLRRLAVSMPSAEYRFDGQEAWYGMFDPTTGEEYHTPYVVGTAFSTTQRKLPGAQKCTGILARAMATEYAPLRIVYCPRALVEGRYSPREKLELITAAERPGEMGLRAQMFSSPPELVSGEMVYWLDPAQDDRPVKIIQTDFKTGSTDIRQQIVVECGEYAVLPAPNGHTYPTAYTWTGYGMRADGKLVASQQEKVTYHFFPGKSMPALPKGVGTMP